MRESRLYLDAPLAVDNILSLGEDESHYLLKVLRLKERDSLRVFNGRDGEFRASLTPQGRRRAELRVAERLRSQPDSALWLHLGLALSKGDRLDYGIQKATELGVSEITLLSTEFCEVQFKQESRLENKLRHWRRIAIHASEQSERLSVPVINAPLAFSVWCEQRQEALNLIAHPGLGDGLGETDNPERVSLTTGPEGGFSDREVEMASKAGLSGLSLGPRILRAETAPVAALTLLQYEFGDLRSGKPGGRG